VVQLRRDPSISYLARPRCAGHRCWRAVLGEDAAGMAARYPPREGALTSLWENSMLKDEGGNRFGSAWAVVRFSFFVPHGEQGATHRSLRVTSEPLNL
jgi:hypothetical protein